MTLGAEPKKAVTLLVLLAVAAVLLYRNVLAPSPGGPPSSPAASAPRRGVAEAVQSVTAPPAPAPVRSSREGALVQEFRPSLRARRPEDRPDPATIDPTLKLGLLAQIQSVALQTSGRNLFEFGAPPRPVMPEPKIVPQPKADPASMAAAKPIPVVPVKPPPPPIPLKFYGYVQEGEDTGTKRAFFLNGEEIFVASEGEVVEKRYKIVSIGLTSAVIEDTQSDSRQTIALEPPPNA